MKKIALSQAIMLALIAFILAACSKNSDSNLQQPVTEESLKQMMAENGANPDEMSLSTFENTDETEARHGNDRKGFLYTETNAQGTNEILVYKIKPNGLLDYKATVASGGAGTGAGLGSQEALAINRERNLLFAVNAASNSVSSFKIHSNGSLTLAHTINSGGTTPVSVAVHGNLLYVLNRGSDNIHGFHVNYDGMLTSINGSTRPLSGTGVDAPQISFTPHGDWIIVTEKATNIVGTFKVWNNGTVGNGIFTNSTGATPFGFAFSRDKYVIVSNAAGGNAGAGSATSYIVANNGVPHALNGAVPNYQGAPCWVATTKYGRFAYVTNTASNSVSSYYVAPWGRLYLVHAAAAQTGMGPVDVVVANDNVHVYILNGASDSITELLRKPFGGLEVRGSITGLPAGTTGLATF